MLFSSPSTARRSQIVPNVLDQLHQLYKFMLEGFRMQPHCIFTESSKPESSGFERGSWWHTLPARQQDTRLQENKFPRIGYGVLLQMEMDFFIV